MKVKKLLNQKSYPKVVQMSNPLKNSDPEVNVSSLSPTVGDGMALNSMTEETVLQDMPQLTDMTEGQPNGTEESTQENEDDIEMPELFPMTDFHSNESAEEEVVSINVLPPLYPIPPIPSNIYENNGLGFDSLQTNTSLNQNQVNNDSILNPSVNPIMSEDLDSILLEFPELLDVCDTIDMSKYIGDSTQDSVQITQNYDLNVNSNETIVTNESNLKKSELNCVTQNSNQFVCPKSSKSSQPLNDSVVSIDLSDISNSPQTPNQRPTQPSNQRPTQPSNLESSVANQMPNNETPVSLKSPTQRKIIFNEMTPKVNQLSNGFSQFFSQTPRKKNQTVKRLEPFNYCAEDHRYFNLTRTSARHKADDDDSSALAHLDYSAIDGSKYEAKVTKWSEEDMDEEKRKDILRRVVIFKFDKSIYDSDVNVFYCWKAFEGESNTNTALFLMRLDPGGKKSSRFTKYQTRLFLLSGQQFSSTVYVENGKQKKSIEVGQEVMIPPHTRYELTNRGVESTYFYVIVSNPIN